jgi:hypothetical protein
MGASRCWAEQKGGRVRIRQWPIRGLAETIPKGPSTKRGKIVLVSPFGSTALIGDALLAELTGWRKSQTGTSTQPTSFVNPWPFLQLIAIAPATQRLLSLACCAWDASQRLRLFQGTGLQPIAKRGPSLNSCSSAHREALYIRQAQKANLPYENLSEIFIKALGRQ